MRPVLPIAILFSRVVLSCLLLIPALFTCAQLPVFTTEPEDLTVSCSNSIQNAFSNWYNADAGAVADNGNAEVQALISLQHALDSLQVSLTGCSGTGSLSLGFIAVNTSGNTSSDTLYASFIVDDFARPQIVLPATDLAIPCTASASDSLADWLTRIGGAVATDNCDTLPQWFNYSWTDSNGNAGSGDFSSSPNIPIQRLSCLWSVDVSFFITDACGNINSTRARFSITGDNDAPLLQSFPADITLLCNQQVPIETPVFIDACDGMLNTDFSELSTQSQDSFTCSHYNYTLQRQWIATDACGNSSSHVQTISIMDTLAPMLNFESIVARDCDEDLDNYESFIDVVDNCSPLSVSYTDSLLATGQCISRYIRRYRIEDICQNRREVNQQLQIEDFSGPEFVKPPRNEIVSCGQDNINLRFQTWVNNFGFAETTDNCNAHKRFVRNIPGLTDSLLIVNAAPARLKAISCQDGATDDIVFSQEFYFYAFDVCGNISSRVARFMLLDTLPPTIPNCPVDREIILPEDNCSIVSSINLPFAVDPCLSQDDILWDLTVDGVFNYEGINESIDFDFDIGQHTVRYSLKDCSGNISQCTQSITVRDTFPPVMDCPDDFSVYLGNDECKTTLSLPQLRSFNDNCFGPADFSGSMPGGEAFINFNFNPGDSSYTASSFIIAFEDIIGSKRIFKPTLTIEYALNIDAPSRVVLKSEFSEELFVLEKAPCVRQRHKLLIDEAQFNVWSLDKDVNFFLVVENRNGKGVLPCDPDKLDGMSDVDEFSFFRLTLEYTEIDPELVVRNASGLILSGNPASFELESGEYTLEYAAQDMDGNTSTCSSMISIIDTVPPVINCSDQNIVLTPDTDEFIDINLDDLNIDVRDNCGIDRISYFPSDFSCQQINRTVSLVVQAWDEQDNFTFCTSLLTIRAARLQPDFIAGLCLADTLLLFANVDQDIGGQFSWTGPGGFVSNDRDPVITNVGLQNSGVYTLNLTTQQGCQFTGTVNIDISQFSIPVISADNIKICEGEPLRLEANVFTEDVSYNWYLGTPGNGLLLSQTQNEFLELFPVLGRNSYYVIVDGDNCSSEPSEPIEIEVVRVPVASVRNQFISVCEGGSIKLETDLSNATLDYIWTGPAGYSAQGRNPTAIPNASEINEGLYSLVVSNGTCLSDPVMTQVIVNEKPERPVISGDEIYCASSTAILEAITGSSVIKYNWFFNGMPYTSINSPLLSLNNVGQAEEGDWQVIVDDGICTSDSSEIFILDIEAKPTIGASNNGPVCDGDTVRLTSSFLPNASYEWEGPEGRRFFSREIAPRATNGTYTVTVTTENGCTAVAGTTVTVRLKPRITALSNTAQECMPEGESINLNPTVFPPGNYIYSWTGPQGFSSDAPLVIIDSLVQADAGIYTLVVQDANCQSEPSTTELDFTIIPEKPVITGDLSICASDTLRLDIENPPDGQGNLFVWTSPTGQVTVTEPFLEIAEAQVGNRGLYRVIQEKNGCPSPASDPVTVSISTIPDPPNITGPEFTCEGESISLISSFEQAVDYIWLLPGGESLVQSSRTLVIPEYSLADTGSYRVILRRGDCLSDPSPAFELNIDLPPAPAEFGIDRLELCKGIESEYELCLNTSDASARLFRLLRLEPLQNISESLDSCLYINIDALQAGDSFRLVAESINGNCISVSSDTLTVEVSSIPSSSAEAETTFAVACMDKAILLMANDPGTGIDLLWTSSQDLTFEAETAPVTRVSGLQTGVNTIYLNSSTDACGIYDTDTITVRVPGPITATTDEFSFSAGTEYIVDPLLNDIFSEAVTLRIVESQLPADISVENKLLVIRPLEELRGDFIIEYEICYEDCPEFCSQGLIQLTLLDESNCQAGNIITPNQDGYNDQFTLSCVDGQALPDNALIIFNIWGDEIFRASPYMNDWQGTFNGEALPAGTYYYFFDPGDGSGRLSGFIVLER